MAQIQVGDSVPSVTLYISGSEGPSPVDSAEFFKGRRTVLFTVPGAFTPTCSAKHVPGYLEHAGALRDAGIDQIACLSVNDAFVMGAWGADQNSGDQVVMLADGGEFTKALGLELDLGGRAGLGVRCTRSALVIDDGKVTGLFIEPNPGELDVSSAENILASLK
ncbi:MAG: peroxiredoxin [Gammaproteobacteria bacterium AqS3]|nr:peroxiredoxin [Gammaproteobacteria bacterium AqS3]